MKKEFIFCDSEEGLKLGLSSWVYDHVRVVNMLPYCLDFVEVYFLPKTNKELVISDLLDKLSKTPARFTCPEETIEKMALERGWEREIQPEGTVNVNNLKLFSKKNIGQTNGTEAQEGNNPVFPAGTNLDDLFFSFTDN